MTTATRLIDEFYNGTAEKDWPAWGAEAVALLERMHGAVTTEQILHCADLYGDARIMASRGRVDRSEVDEARKELRALVNRALGAAPSSAGASGVTPTAGGQQ